MDISVRVLIWSESERQAFSTQALLQKTAGFFSIVSSSRTQMESLLSESHWDTVVCALGNGDLTAGQAVTAVRATSLSVPILIVSGVNTAEAALDALRRGATDYLVEGPAFPQLLPAAIISVVENVRTQSQPSDNRTDGPKWHRAIFEQSRNALLIVEQDGRVVDANRQAGALTGFTISRLLEMNLSQLGLSPLDTDALETVIPDSVGEESLCIEQSLCRQDGRRLPIEVTLAPIDYKGGRLSLVVLRDITERKHKEDGLLRSKEALETTVEQRTADLIRTNRQLRKEIQDRKRAEEAIRKSEAVYRTLVEQAEDGIAYVQDGLLSFVSPRLAAMIGYEVDEITGHPFIDFIAPDQRAEVLDRHERRMNGEEVPNVYESALLHRDGSCISIEFGVGVIPFSDENSALVIVRDITDRKQTQAALRESEERLELALDGAGLAMWDHNFVTNEVVRSDRWAEMLGYTPEEISNEADAWRSLIHTDDLDEVLKQAYDHESGLVPEFKAEHRMKARDGTWKWVLNWGRVVERDKNGKAVRAVGIHMDISERKQAEEKLARSETWLRSLYDGSLDSIFISDSKGRFVDVNRAAESLTGYSIDELKGMSIPDLHKAEDLTAYEESFDVIMAGNSVMSESHIVRKDGVRVATEFSNQRVVIDGIPYMHTVARDVTDRHEAARALASSEEINRAVIENSPLGISVRSRTGLLLSYNRAWQEFWCLTDDEIRDYTERERQKLTFDARDSYLRKWRSEIRRVYDQGGTFKIPAVRLENHRSGELHWASQYFYAINGDDGEVERVVILTEDVTEAKLTRRALREAERKYRIVTDSAGVVIWESTIEGDLTFLTSAFESMFGYSIEEGLKLNMRDILTPASIATVERVVQGRLEQWASGNAESEPERLELESVAEDGSLFWVEVLGQLTFDDSGTPSGLSGVTRNITDRKRAESALQSSEDTARALLNSSLDATLLLDADGILLDANDTFAGRFDSTADALKGTSVWDLFPADVAERRKKWIQTAIETGEIQRNIDERQGMWNDINICPIPDDKGEVTRVAVMAQDITERRRANEALLESETRLKMALEGAREGLWDLNVATNEVYLSPRWFVMLGYDPEELPQDFTTWVKLLHPDDRKASINRMRAFTDRKLENYESEFRLMAKDGSWRWILSRGKAVESGDDGSVTRMVGTHTDITVRKEVEQALNESLELLKTAQRFARMGNWKHDLVTGSTVWSEEMYNIFNLDPEGPPLGVEEFCLLVHPDDREMVRGKIQRQLEGNPDALKYRYRILLRTGEVKHLERGAELIYDDAGDLIQIFGTVQDITERTRAEAALKESEARFRAYVENSPAGIIIANADGTLQFANRAACELTGYTDEELLELTLPDLIIVENQTRSAKRFQRKLSEGSIKDEVSVRKKDGSRCEIIVDAVALADDKYIAFCTDITRRIQTEEALRESEQFNQALIRYSPLGISVRSRTGQLLSCNKAWRDTWRFDKQQMNDFFQRERTELKPDERDSYLGEWLPEVVRVYEEGGRLFVPEARYVRSDGSVCWVSQHFYAIMDDGSGEVDRVVILTNDITDRKCAEEALRSSEEQHRTLQENIPVGVFRSTSDGRLLSANPALLLMYGYDSFEEMALVPVESLFRFPEQRKELIEHLKQEGVVHDFETEMVRRDGTYFWVKMGVNAVFDQEGNISHLDGIEEDITVRKQAEETVRITEEKFATLFKSSPDSVYLTRLEDGLVREVNEGALSLLGYTREELIGRSIIPVWADPDDRKAFVHRLKERGECISMETAVRTKDGAIRPVLTSGRLLDIAGEEWVIAISRDITERIEAQKRERAASEERYEQAKRISGVFAHEIRNALFPAAAALSLLKGKIGTVRGDHSSLTEYAKIAERAVTNAAGTTRLISAFNKLDSEIMPERVDIDGVIGDLLQNNRLRIDDAGVSVTLIGPRDIWIKSNRRQLGIVFNNLLLNSLAAISECSDSRIEIGWKENEGNLDVRFEDNGIGIPKDNQERMFEPFFTTRSESGGMGIGLATVRKIVSMYGGSITVSSQSGAGTRFDIKFVLV